MQLTPQTGTRQRTDELLPNELGTWSQHVAPRNASRSGGSEEAAPMASPTAPVLDQEEFPTLEVAAHSKPAPKLKTSTSTQSPETQESVKVCGTCLGQM